MVAVKINKNRKSDYEELCRILEQHAGIEITESKHSMLESRVNKRLQILNINSLSEYKNYILSHKNEFLEFVNVMTTNKTEWFREIEHFNYLKKNIIDEKHNVFSANKPLMIWSAASSSGEEIYSLAMFLEEHMSAKHSYRILGSDINNQMVQLCEKAEYKKSHITQQVRSEYVLKYFQITSKPDVLKIHPDLKKWCKFRVFNLLTSDWPMLIQFDIIFLRNVMIYFQPQTIEQVVGRLYKYLKPNGLLILGHSESLQGIEHKYHYLGSSVYQKK